MLNTTDIVHGIIMQITDHLRPERTLGEHQRDTLKAFDVLKWALEKALSEIEGLDRIRELNDRPYATNQEEGINRMHNGCQELLEIITENSEYIYKKEL